MNDSEAGPSRNQVYGESPDDTSEVTSEEILEKILKKFGDIYDEKLEAYKVCRPVLIDDLENVLRYHKVGHVPVHARVKDWDRARKTAGRRYKECVNMSEIWGQMDEEAQESYCNFWNFDENSAKVFESGEEIFEAMHDLLGARVALYFPDAARKISSILEEAGYTIVKPVLKGGMQDLSRLRKFVDKRTRMLIDGTTIPDDQKFREGQFEKAFSGYGAFHLIVNLPTRLQRRIGLPEDDWKILNIEIQVGTVVMHAWSEVEHDVIYKPLSGLVLSDEVERIVDLINGIALTGEVALRQLQATTQRLRESQPNFETPDPQGTALMATKYLRDHGELGAWLEQYFAAKNSPTSNLPRLSDWIGLKELFEVSASYGLHSYESFRKTLKSITEIPGAFVIDELVPLHILVHCAEKIEERNCKDDDADAEKARFSALQVSRILQLVHYFKCKQSRYRLEFIHNGPGIHSFLDILHPKLPKLSGLPGDFELIAKPIVTRTKMQPTGSDVPSKEQDLRERAVFLLAKRGFMATPSMQSSGKHWIEQKHAIPGTIVRHVSAGKMELYAVPEVLYKNHAPPGTFLTKGSSEDSFFEGRTHPDAFIPWLDDNKDVPVGRWRCLYGKLDWNIGYEPLEEVEALPRVDTKPYHFEGENMAAILDWYKNFKTLHRVNITSRHLGKSRNKDKMSEDGSDREGDEEDDSNEDEDEDEGEEGYNRPMDVSAIYNAVLLRNRLHPVLELQAEKELWIGYGGVRDRIGYPANSLGALDLEKGRHGKNIFAARV